MRRSLRLRVNFDAEEFRFGSLIGQTMRPVRITVVSVLFVVVTGAVALFLSFSGSKELDYQGRPISYWFAQLPPTFVSSQGTMHVSSMMAMGQQYGTTGAVWQSFAALDSFGTNAIPYFLSKLQDSDSFVEKKATHLAWKHGVKSLPFRNAICERAQSVTALIHLRELPPGTLQMLASLSTNAPPDIAQAAKHVLLVRSGAAQGNGVTRY